MIFRLLTLSLLLAMVLTTPGRTQVGPQPPTASPVAPAPPPLGGMAPRTIAPPKQGEQENAKPPSERGQSHMAEVDPFLKYAEDVKLNVTQLDLRAFPTVRLFANVHDKNGAQIRTLQERDFTLSENRKPVTDLHFGNRDQLNLPLAVMLVVDISGSMQQGGAIDLEKDAIRQFVGQLGPDDRVGLITFSDAAIPEVHLTKDKDQVLHAVDTMTAWGETALFDAVYRGIEETLADDQPARHAILVMSDGGDNKSVETPQTVSELFSSKATATNKGFPIYCLGLGPEADSGVMGSIATATNGLYVASPTAQDLANVYQDILRQIQNEYLLEYTSPTVATPGQIVDLELGLNNVRSFTPATYTYRSPGLGAALGRALWPGLLVIGILLAILVLTTIFKITRRTWVTVMVTSLEGRDYTLGGDSLDIGRSEACGIRVGLDPAMQPVHATLHDTRDGWVVEAYSQTAPVIFGKQLLARKLLRHGDTFILGTTPFVFNERIERPGVGEVQPLGSLVPVTAFANAGDTSSAVAPSTPSTSREPGPVRTLIGLSGPYAGQSFELVQGETAIGRTEGQVQLPNDSQVSRRHCTVESNATTTSISDVGSTNGTRLNAQPLQAGLSQPLHYGDVVGIGSGDFRAE